MPKPMTQDSKHDCMLQILAAREELLHLATSIQDDALDDARHLINTVEQRLASIRAAFNVSDVAATR